MLRDYRNGQPYTSISNPYNLSARAVSSELDPSELSLDLAEVKAHKEAELRDAADRWGGIEPMIWQFMPASLVAGMHLDVDAYRGTREQLLALTRAEE